MEMLVHHADAEAERIGRIADVNGLAVDGDVALVGGVGAEQDIHQGGLAGAVFAEQPQYVARFQRQVDAGAGLARPRNSC